MGSTILLVVIFTVGMYILDHQGPEKSNTSNRRGNNMLPTDFLSSDRSLDFARRSYNEAIFGGT